MTMELMKQFEATRILPRTKTMEKERQGRRISQVSSHWRSLPWWQNRSHYVKLIPRINIRLTQPPNLSVHIALFIPRPEQHKCSPYSIITSITKRINYEGLSLQAQTNIHVYALTTVCRKTKRKEWDQSSSSSSSSSSAPALGPTTGYTRKEASISLGITLSLKGRQVIYGK